MVGILVWTYSPGERSADFKAIDTKAGLDDQPLLVGERVDPAQWATATISMDRGSARETDVDDFLRTGTTPPIVSARLKSFLEKRSSQIQWLPIKVLHRDKKKKVPDPQYWIANLLEVYPAIDDEKSRLRRNPNDKDWVITLNQLSLDESKIPPTAEVFRVVGLRHLVFSRAGLVADARREGFTGLGFRTLAELDTASTPFAPKLMGGG